MGDIKYGECEHGNNYVTCDLCRAQHWPQEVIGKLQAENEELKNKYYDLLLQVAKKFPDESRHETAKRYIQERETSTNGPAKESK